MPRSGRARRQGARPAGRQVAAAGRSADRGARRSAFFGEPRVNVLKLNLALDAIAAPEHMMAMANRRPRPVPDALLALAERERRGKLKVFLGAAPGVGKTFAMLSAARRLKAEGSDVVVGLVETHGRAETAALLEGLEVLPRRTSTIAAARSMEFDLDAALARKPELIIVDELAHTNAPDSRHPKRYQDVEELLDAGIDVWTALNIQHLESLSDVVAAHHRHRRARDRARHRPREGRRGRPRRSPAGRADRAAEGGQGLSARECRAAPSTISSSPAISPRCANWRCAAPPTASTTRWSTYLRQNAIEGPWPTAERILVCVGPDPLSKRWCGRQPAGRAGSMPPGSPFTSTDRPRNRRADALKRVEDDLRLAARLGAETRLAARDLPAEVLRYARRENITQIVLGRSRAAG